MPTNLTRTEFIDSWIYVDSTSNPIKLLDNIERLYKKTKTNDQVKIINDMIRVIEKGVI